GFRSRLHGSVVAHVARGVSRRASRATNLLANFAQRILAPACKEHAGSELRKAQRHGPAQACSATGQENRSLLQQVFLKHAAPPYARMVSLENWEGEAILLYQRPHGTYFRWKFLKRRKRQEHSRSELLGAVHYDYLRSKYLEASFSKKLRFAG